MKNLMVDILGVKGRSRFSNFELRTSDIDFWFKAVRTADAKRKGRSFCRLRNESASTYVRDKEFGLGIAEDFLAMSMRGQEATLGLARS
jgi:hypothetical protein